MRIFVGEYICGGGLGDQVIEDVFPDLRKEGEAMLRAIVEDLSQVAETVVPVDARFSIPLAASEIVTTDPGQMLWAQWVKAAQACDAAMVVIPEYRGLLAQGVAMLRAGGVDVIAGSGDFLRVASDKWLTAKAFHEAGIPHPVYITDSDRRFEDELRGFPEFVVKPRDGCASQDILTFDSFDEADAVLCEGLILQAKMPGQPISVSLVASQSTQTYLPAVRQDVADETFSYMGGCGPLAADLQCRATALASRAVSAMPPTVRGFVGLDLLMGDEPSQDCVIEINPRLSTSYVGLRKMISGNVAARLFDFETGPVSCIADVDTVRWTADGRVWVDDLAIDPA